MSPRRASPLLLVLALLSAGLPTAAAEETLFADDLESGAPGWTTSGLWHLSTVTGSTSFWYGDEATGTYATDGSANSGRLVSPPIDLSAHAGASIVLRFLETVEHEDNCGFERPIVEVSADGGPFAAVSDRCVLGGPSSSQVTVPLSGFGGSVVQIGFLWDTRDDFFNEHFGWSVDDVVVEVVPTPELSLASTSAVPAGNTVVLSADVANSPATDAFGVTVGYVLETSGGVFVTDGTAVVDVPAGATVHVDLAALSLDSGDYVLTTTVDSVGAYPEANEGDNVGILPFTFIESPDLAAGVGAFTDGSGTFIETTTVNFGGAVETPFLVRYQTFDQFGFFVDEGALVLDGLPGDATFTHTFGPLAYAPGDYQVVFTVDANETVAEAEEGNNVAVTFFQVAGDGPDLQVAHDHLAAVPSGTPVETQVHAFNAGNAPATDVEILVQAFDDFGTVVSSESHFVPELCAGCVETRFTTFFLPDGHYTIVSTIDPASLVEEQDEGNNAFADEVIVGGSGPGDLAVTQFFHQPDPAVEGDFVTLFGMVENLGAGFADGSELGLFVLWPDGTEEQFAQVSIPPLGPGAGQFFEVPIGPVPAGSYDLRATADVLGQVPEGDEGNNDAFHTLVVQSPGDVANLVAGAFADPAFAGQATTLHAIVSNAGPVDAGPFRVDVFVDGALVESLFYGGLASGTVDEALIPWTATAGPHQLDVLVDAGGEVAESDEVDNFASFAFFVDGGAPPAPADLAVTILGIDRAPIRTDLGDLPFNPIGRRTVEVAACNLGAEPIFSGALWVTLQSAAPKDVHESSIPLGTFDLPQLDGGECATFHARWDAAGSVGDVDIVARGWTPDEVDGDATNDGDVYEDYVLVGGFGGVALL